MLVDEVRISERETIVIVASFVQENEPFRIEVDADLFMGFAHDRVHRGLVTVSLAADRAPRVRMLFVSRTLHEQYAAIDNDVDAGDDHRPKRRWRSVNTSMH